MNIVQILGTPLITFPLRKIVCPPTFTGILLKTPLAGSLPFAALSTVLIVFSCPPSLFTNGPRLCLAAKMCLTSLLFFITRPTASSIVLVENWLINFVLDLTALLTLTHLTAQVPTFTKAHSPKMNSIPSFAPSNPALDSDSDNSR